MKKLLIILSLMCVYSFFKAHAVTREFEVVETSTEYEGFQTIYIATCPICGRINKYNPYNRFISEYCTHIYISDKTEQMVFIKTNEELLIEKISKLEKENKELKSKVNK